MSERRGTARQRGGRLLFGVVPALLALLLAGEAAAATLSGSDAASAVRSWLSANGNPFESGLPAQIDEVTAYPGPDGSTAWYIVAMKPRGFVVVAADDRAGPVVAFSATGYFDPAAGNPLYSLLWNDIPNRLQAARSSTSLSNLLMAAVSWDDVPDPKARICRVRVPPLITSSWGQSTVQGQNYYNFYTPSNYLAGCVAVAMAQTIRLHRQEPPGGVGHNSLIGFVDEEPTFIWTHGGDHMGGPYKWEAMPDDPASLPYVDPDQQLAVGALCADAGAAVGSDYSYLHGTGAFLENVPGALAGTFGFAQGGVIGPYNHEFPLSSTNDAIRMINPNLDAGLPVLAGLIPQDPKQAAHCAIIDGYGYCGGWMWHHLNMGWDGSGNIWYVLPKMPAAITYKDFYNFSYNMIPRAQGEVVSGWIRDQNGMSMPGISVCISNETTVVTNVTNAKGIFSFIVPGGTNYEVTPLAPGQPVWPASTNVAVGTSVSGGDCGNVWGVNFWVTSRPVSGRVLRGTNALAGVGVTFSGLQTVISDIDGYYIAPVPNGWSGTVTPSMVIGGSFSPAFLGLTNVVACLTNSDFVWLAPTMVGISGTVFQADSDSGVGLPGATISFSGCGVTVQSDSNGDYRAYVPVNWTGTSTVSYAYGGSFTPVDQWTYDNPVTNDIGFQCFFWLPPQDLTVSGRIIRRDTGTAVSNATVSSSAGAVATAFDGSYSLRIPYLWSGNLTPSHARGGMFAPPSRSIANVHLSTAGQNFLWTAPPPLVSGRVVNVQNGLGEPSLTVALSDGSATGRTDASGIYTLQLPWRGWTGAILPTWPQGSFQPVSLSVTGIIYDTWLPDLLWTPPGVFTGLVTRVDTLGPVAGVTITLSGGAGAAITDTNGSYQIAVPRGWSGSLTPSMASGGTFAPDAATADSVSSGVHIVNFSWTPPDVCVAGHVTYLDNGQPAAGISLLFSNAAPILPFAPVVGGGSSVTVTSDGNGAYSLYVPYGWSGTVIPSHSRGGVFTPAAHAYSDVSALLTNEDFQWTPPAPAIVGRILRSDNLAGAGGLQVVFSNSPALVSHGATNPLQTATTDADGAYEGKVPRNWSGTVTPVIPPEGGTFDPVSRGFTNVVSDIAGTATTWFVWSPPSVVLGVCADPPARGRVSGGGFYLVGATATISAVANAGSRFVSWQDGGTNATRKVVVPAGGALYTARFVALGPVLSISGTLDFGDVLTGHKVTRTLRLSNSGTAAFALTGIGMPQVFFASPTYVNLAPGAVATITFTFLPYDRRAYTATVTFATSPSAIGTTSVSAQGRGVGVEDWLSFSGLFSFGDLAVGQSLTHAISVHNSGNQTVTIRSADWSPSGTGFSAGGLPLSIAAGRTASFSVRFAPGRGGSWSPVMSLTTSPSAGDAIAFRMTGSAYASVAGSWSSSLDGRTYLLYLWQAGRRIDGQLLCKQDAAVSDQYFGGLDGSIMTGALWHAGARVGSLWQVCSAGLTGTLSRTTIGDARAVKWARLSAAVPAGIARPVRSDVRSGMAAAAARDAAARIDLSLLVLDVSALPVDGTELLALRLVDGRLQAECPALNGTGGGVFHAQTAIWGADTNGDGLPDALAAAVGAPLGEGATFLVVRRVGGFAVAEAPVAGTAVEGAVAVPLGQWPAIWSLIPASH